MLDKIQLTFPRNHQIRVIVFSRAFILLALFIVLAGCSDDEAESSKHEERILSKIEDLKAQMDALKATPCDESESQNLRKLEGKYAVACIPKSDETKTGLFASKPSCGIGITITRSPIGTSYSESIEYEESLRIQTGRYTDHPGTDKFDNVEWLSFDGSGTISMRELSEQKLKNKYYNRKEINIDDVKNSARLKAIVYGICGEKKDCVYRGCLRDLITEYNINQDERDTSVTAIVRGERQRNP